MKINKYQKLKNNEYLLITEEDSFKLYDDVIIKHELLLKKEIDKQEKEEILKENKLLEAYYEGLNKIKTKMRSEKELRELLGKAGYKSLEVNYALERLKKEGYINAKAYIEAYVHDSLALKVVGEEKISYDLINLGFKKEEIDEVLDSIDKEVYQNKIKSYGDKRLKSNKKSAREFKQKLAFDLENRGFRKEDINSYISKLELEDNKEEIAKIVNKLKIKYSRKYNGNEVKLKIKSYLYQKGYKVNIEDYWN